MSQLQPPPERYLLQADHRSTFNPKCLYARKGQIVKLVKQAGEVSLVEREDGERFPVHQSKLVKI